MNDWQSWIALIVVALTAGIMLYRTLFKKKTGCGSDCGCGKGTLPKKNLQTSISAESLERRDYL